MKERLKERYDIYLTQEAFYNLSYTLRRGVGVHLLKYEKKNNQEVCLAKLDGKEVVVVYCLQRKTATTALPIKKWEPRIKKVQAGYRYLSDGRCIDTRKEQE